MSCAATCCRYIAAEDLMDAGSLGFGAGMCPDHVARSMDSQRCDASHHRKHHAFDDAYGDAEEIGIEHDREDVFARGRWRQASG